MLNTRGRAEELQAFGCLSVSCTDQSILTKNKPQSHASMVDDCHQLRKTSREHGEIIGFKNAKKILQCVNEKKTML